MKLYLIVIAIVCMQLNAMGQPTSSDSLTKYYNKHIKKIKKLVYWKTYNWISSNYDIVSIKRKDIYLSIPEHLYDCFHSSIEDDNNLCANSSYINDSYIYEFYVEVKLADQSNDGVLIINFHLTPNGEIKHNLSTTE